MVPRSASGLMERTDCMMHGTQNDYGDSHKVGWAVDGNGIFPISTTLLENMTSIRHHQRNSHVPNPDGMQLKETIEGAMEDSGYDSGQKDDPSPAYSRSSSLEVEAPRLMKDLPPLPLNTTTISELMKQLPRELLGKVTDIWEQDNKPLRQRRSSSLEPFWAVPSPEPPLYTVQPYFEIKRSPKGGYGAFALQDIRKNKVILEESPLLEAHTATFIQEFEKLSKKEQGEVMSLTCFSELSDDKRIATFKTNRFVTTHGRDGLFRIACRFNHSCRRDIDYRFDALKKKLVMWTRQAVKQGDEIFISYGVTGETLWRNYGFVCECGFCRPWSPRDVVVEEWQLKMEGRGKGEDDWAAGWGGYDARDARDRKPYVEEWQLKPERKVYKDWAASWFPAEDTRDEDPLPAVEKTEKSKATAAQDWSWDEAEVARLQAIVEQAFPPKMPEKMGIWSEYGSGWSSPSSQSSRGHLPSSDDWA